MTRSRAVELRPEYRGIFWAWHYALHKIKRDPALEVPPNELKSIGFHSFTSQLEGFIRMIYIQYKLRFRPSVLFSLGLNRNTGHSKNSRRCYQKHCAFLLEWLVLDLIVQNT